MEITMIIIPKKNSYNDMKPIFIQIASLSLLMCMVGLIIFFNMFILRSRSSSYYISNIMIFGFFFYFLKSNIYIKNSNSFKSTIITNLVYLFGCLNIIILYLISNMYYQKYILSQANTPRNITPPIQNPIIFEVIVMFILAPILETCFICYLSDFYFKKII